MAVYLSNICVVLSIFSAVTRSHIEQINTTEIWNATKTASPKSPIPIVITTEKLSDPSRSSSPLTSPSVVGRRAGVRVVHLNHPRVPFTSRRPRRPHVRCPIRRRRKLRRRRRPFFYGSWKRTDHHQGGEESAGVSSRRFVNEDFLHTGLLPYGFDGEYFPIKEDYAVENKTVEEVQKFEKFEQRRDYENPYEYRTISETEMIKNIYMPKHQWRPMVPARPHPVLQSLWQSRPQLRNEVSSKRLQQSKSNIRREFPESGLPWKPLPEYPMHEPIPGQDVFPPKIPKFKPITFRIPLDIPIFRTETKNSQRPGYSNNSVFYTTRPSWHDVKPVYENMHETDMLRSIFFPSGDNVNVFHKPVSFQQMYGTATMPATWISNNNQRNWKNGRQISLRTKAIPRPSANKSKEYTQSGPTANKLAKDSKMSSDIKAYYASYRTSALNNNTSDMLSGQDLLKPGDRNPLKEKNNNVVSDYFKVVDIFPNAPWVIISKSNDDRYTNNAIKKVGISESL